VADKLDLLQGTLDLLEQRAANWQRISNVMDRIFDQADEELE